MHSNLGWHSITPLDRTFFGWNMFKENSKRSRYILLDVQVRPRFRIHSDFEPCVGQVGDFLSGPFARHLKALSQWGSDFQSVYSGRHKVLSNDIIRARVFLIKKIHYLPDMYRERLKGSISEGAVPNCARCDAPGGKCSASLSGSLFGCLWFANHKATNLRQWDLAQVTHSRFL